MTKPPPLELHGTVPLEDQFDTVERLHTICDHLRTGRFGQREVWEEWLMGAAADIKRLQALSVNNAHSWDAIVRERDDYKAESERHIKTIAQLRHQIESFTLDAHAEVERWRAMYSEAQAEIKQLRAEIELMSK